MIIFIGSIEKGYFIEDIAKKWNIECGYIKENLKIGNQVNDILEVTKCKYMVFDVEQYIDSAEILADEIHRISLVNNARPIIYASGYLPNSDIIVQLMHKNIYNYIFATNLSDVKDELNKCMNGYFDNNINKILEEFPIANEVKKEPIYLSFKHIGVAGACRRIGASTQAFQIVQYLILNGYNACYVEMNSTGYVSKIFDNFNDVEHDDVIGRVTYKNIDMFYKYENIMDIQNQGYDYYVYDYGVYSDVDFNKSSFSEKDLKLFIIGSKANEIEFTYEIIKNNFYKNVFYIFNFISDGEMQEVLEMMDEKAKNTFFSAYVPDPFSLTNSKSLDMLFQIKTKNIEPKKKSELLFDIIKNHLIKKKKINTLKKQNADLDKKSDVVLSEPIPKSYTVKRKKINILDIGMSFFSIILTIVIIAVIIGFFVSPDIHSQVLGLIEKIANVFSK